MTLFEVLNALCFIEKQVTNAHFATNVTKIDSNLVGDWKEWNIKFHTEEEDNIRKETIEKACAWLSNCESLQMRPYNIEQFKKAMEAEQ